MGDFVADVLTKAPTKTETKADVTKTESTVSLTENAKQGQEVTKAQEGTKSQEVTKAQEGAKKGEVVESGKKSGDVQRLSKGEIDKLKKSGEDPHKLKGPKDASKKDLFKDKKGNIEVRPKSGKGTGEPTGLNIKNL